MKVHNIVAALLVIPALAFPVPPPGGSGGRYFAGQNSLNVAGSSVISPTDLSGLHAWYKADNLVTNLAGTTPPANGDAIKGWGDSSGNNRVLSTNNPTAAGPTWNNSATTGKNQGAIVFASGKNIRVGFTGLANSTICTVWRNNSSGASHMVVDSTNSANRNSVYINGSDNFTIYSGGAFLTGGSAVANPSWNIEIGVFNGSGNDSIYTNGVLAVTGVSGSDTLDGLNVGSDNTGANNLGAGEYVGEIIIYNRNLNSTELGQIDAYLNSRWTIH